MAKANNNNNYVVKAKKSDVAKDWKKGKIYQYQ